MGIRLETSVQHLEARTPVSAVQPARAAEYVRMSTEHQRYSTENQSAVIRRYAAERGYEIVRTYADEGKSGLSLGGRNALQQLLEDVQEGRADFRAILVYDVSRWGRFQDADESAFYEYVCKRAGVAVHFCAEQFENDGGLAATVLKGMKRVMAGEYSRELSTKVFLGQCRLIELGFRQGGVAGYGLRRLLLDEERNPKGELGSGQHKSIQTDRVILIPGPDCEVTVVRRIYSLFLEQGLGEAAIAKVLNEEGISTDSGQPWTRARVATILTNHKYVGDNIFNRRSYKLKQRMVSNPPSIWIRRVGAFDAVVDRASFDAVQYVIEARRWRPTDQEMLDALRALLDERGGISAIMIDEAAGMLSSAAYRKRFGTLGRAYRLVGWSQGRDDAYVAINRSLREMFPAVVAKTIARIEGAGAKVEPGRPDGRFTVNHELSFALVISRCCETSAGSCNWIVRFDPGKRADITIAVRMDRGNAAIKDFYVLPRLGLAGPILRLAEENGTFLDAFRFDDLKPLVYLMSRIHLRSAA